MKNEYRKILSIRIDDVENLIKKEITYPGISKQYIVESNGEIFCKKNNRYMKQHMDCDGYMKVTLRKTDGGRITIRMHRIIAWEFCAGYSKETNRIFVNHKNCIRSDNDYRNLEWVTIKENIDHSYKYGYKGKCSFRALSDIEVHKICRLLDKGLSVKEAYTSYTGTTNTNKYRKIYKYISNIKLGYTYKDISSLYSFLKK